MAEVNVSKAKYEEEAVKYRKLYENELMLHSKMSLQINNLPVHSINSLPELLPKFAVARDYPVSAREMFQRESNLIKSLREQLDHSFTQHIGNANDRTGENDSYW